MTSEEEKNKALVRRFLEAHAKGDLGALDDLLAPAFVDHSLLDGQEPGREGYKQQLAEQHAALSDLRFVIEDQVAKDDKVVTRITWRTIHDRGEYFGLMSRGTEVDVTSMTIHCIEGGKITEEWSEGSGDAEVAQAHLEQERIERERVEQDLRVARSIQQTSLPKEVPTLEGWQISPYCRPAREVGGDFYDFHLLSDGQVGLRCGGRHRQGCASGIGDDRGLRLLGGSRHSVGFFLAGGGTGAGQRSIVGSHPTQHVCHLLLRHPRPQERAPCIRQRRTQPPVLLPQRTCSERPLREGDAFGADAGDEL